MSTRLLYHAFGLRGYRYVKSEYLGGGVLFTVEPEPKNAELYGLRLTERVSQRRDSTEFPRPADRDDASFLMVAVGVLCFF